MAELLGLHFEARRSLNEEAKPPSAKSWREITSSFISTTSLIDGDKAKGQITCLRQHSCSRRESWASRLHFNAQLLTLNVSLGLQVRSERKKNWKHPRKEKRQPRTRAENPDLQASLRNL
jgi:hypothetical protein